VSFCQSVPRALLASPTSDAREREPLGAAYPRWGFLLLALASAIGRPGLLLGAQLVEDEEAIDHLVLEGLESGLIFVGDNAKWRDGNVGPANDFSVGQHDEQGVDRALICSLDRIDSSGHYERDNLQMSSLSARGR